MGQDRTAAAIVIGGGIIGVSIAYSLARRQLGRIVLLERGNLGMGSTGRSVASIEPLSAFACVAALQKRSIDVFKDFAQEIGGECGFVPVPMALLAGPGDVAAMRDMIRVGQAAGSDVRELTPIEFAEYESDIDLAGVAAIRYTVDSGYADPTMTTASYADAARRMGVDIRQNTASLRIRVEARRAVGVETANGAISSPVVIVAAGCWSGVVLEQLGLDNPLTVVRHSVATLDVSGLASAPRHSLLDLPLSVYSRPETGKMQLIGSLDPAVGYDPAADGDAELPPSTQDYAMWSWERILTRFPALAEARLRKGWTGLWDISPDSQPLLGALPFQGLYLAAGFSGVGFKIAPAVGEAMAGLVDGDAQARDLLAPLRPSRVQDGQLLRAESIFPDSSQI